MVAVPNEQSDMHFLHGHLRMHASLLVHLTVTPSAALHKCLSGTVATMHCSVSAATSLILPHAKSLPLVAGTYSSGCPQEEGHSADPFIPQMSYIKATSACDAAPPAAPFHLRMPQVKPMTACD